MNAGAEGARPDSQAKGQIFFRGLQAAPIPRCSRTYQRTLFDGAPRSCGAPFVLCQFLTGRSQREKEQIEKRRDLYGNH